MRAPKIISVSTTEPVTAEQSWSHLRVTLVGSPPAPVDADDIALKLSTAREMAEKFTGLSLARQTLLMGMDEFPADDEAITLLRGPVSEILEVTYIDADGAEQVLDASTYELDDFDAVAPMIRLVDEATWPGTKTVSNAVKVRYETGFSQASDSPISNPMPASIKSAILLTLGHLYEVREDSTGVQLHEIPYGAECLLRPYRILNGFA